MREIPAMKGTKMHNILIRLAHFTIFAIAYSAFLFVAWWTGNLQTMYNAVINWI